MTQAVTKRLAVVVEGESPRIAGAFREHFERVRDRMEAPDAGVQLERARSRARLVCRRSSS